MIKISGDPGARGAYAIFSGDQLLQIRKFDYQCLVPTAYGPVVDTSIEQNHGIAGQSPGSTYEQGFNAGWMEAVLNTMTSNPTRIVTAHRWQKGIGVPKLEKAERKKWIHEFVKAKYPDVKIPLYAADAVAIGYYAFVLGGK